MVAVISRIAIQVILASMVASCGGGSNDDDDEVAEPNDVVEPVAVKIALGEDVPETIKAKVVALRTASGSSTNGMPINIPENVQPGTALTVAVDKTNQPLLVGYVDQAGATLDAISTALALARIAIGPVETIRSPIELNSSIRSTPSFNTAVAAVNNSLSQGNPPSQDDSVIAAIDQLLDELDDPSSASAQHNALVKPLALPERRVTSVPMVLHRDNVFQAQMVMATIVTRRAVEIQNRSSIHWLAQILDENGAPIDTLTKPVGTPSLAQIAADSFPFGLLNANGNRRYAIRVYRDASTRRADTVRAGKDLISIVFGIYDPSGLVAKEAERQVDLALKTYEKNPGADAPTLVLDFLKSSFIDNAARSLKNFLKWGTPLPFDSDFLDAIQKLSLDQLKKRVEVVGPIVTAWKATSYIVRLKQSSTAIGDERFAVCLDAEGNLASCAELEIDPMSVKCTRRFYTHPNFPSPLAEYSFEYKGYAALSEQIEQIVSLSAIRSHNGERSSWQAIQSGCSAGWTESNHTGGIDGDGTCDKSNEGPPPKDLKFHFRAVWVSIRNEETGAYAKPTDALAREDVDDGPDLEVRVPLNCP